MSRRLERSAVPGTERRGSRSLRKVLSSVACSTRVDLPVVIGDSPIRRKPAVASARALRSGRRHRQVVTRSSAGVLTGNVCSRWKVVVFYFIKCSGPSRPIDLCAESSCGDQGCGGGSVHGGGDGVYGSAAAEARQRQQERVLSAAGCIHPRT